MSEKTEMTQTPSRRHMLKLSGALAAAMAAGSSAPLLSARAQGGDGTGTTPMTVHGAQSAQEATASQAAEGAMVYVSHEFSPQAVDAPPIPLPPLRVIALTRLAFGPSLSGSEGWGAGATEAEQFVNWVTTQLTPDFSTDADCNARIAAGNLPTLNKSLVQMWTDHMNNPTQNQDFRRDDPANDVYFATFIRAIYSKWQLFEVLADFWHNHFNIYAWDYEYAASTFVHYDRDVIRAHALGNFRTMLEAVAKSPAMLFYLDNYINTVAGPNENWAREMFELHTMGAENYAGVVPRESVPGYASGSPEKYCDGDVYEATRCFTGWRVNDEKKDGNPAFKDDGTFMYDATRHDRFQKIVLAGAHPETWANEAEKDGKVVLDKVSSHPGTARYIVRKLWRRLIGDNVPRPYKGAPTDPPPAPGTDLAHDFLEECAAYWTSLWQDPQQIQKVILKLLTDPKSPFKTTFGEKIKRPYEAAVSMLRAVGAEWKPKRDYWDFFNAYELMGQDLFSRRPPDGYPDVKGAWNNTTSILMRWRFCNWMFEEGVPKDRPEIQVDLNDDTLAVFPTQAGRTPNAVADYWINRILGRAMMNPESRKAVVDMLSRGANPATFQLNANDLKDRIHDAVALILMSPDFQLR